MHLSLEKRIEIFTQLGNILSHPDQNPSCAKWIEEAQLYNPWFTPDNVREAMTGIGNSLQESKIQKWIKPNLDKLKKNTTPKTIGVVMAGNLPLVGFHDFLTVLISGNRILAKLSSDDNKLMPAIAELLYEIEPEIKNFIEFSEGKLEKFDAIIATGSNNTSRYFEYYFGKYPNIIRKNRNGIAILTGNETGSELENLGKDIFLYFGMGCRSISKLFVPEHYDFTNLFPHFEKYKNIRMHSKYVNNYDYYKSIYLINKVKHFDNGFLLLTEENSYASPPSVIYYSYYQSLEEVKTWLEMDRELIQCVIGDNSNELSAIPFGMAQYPELWDYADGIDTLAFLLKL
jgi:hypothetical protein